MFVFKTFINRFFTNDIFPEINNFNKIAVFVGAHAPWSMKDLEAIDKFCDLNNAVVFCDHTSNYNGNYKVLSPILGCQREIDLSIKPDLVIHIGEVTGDYYSSNLFGKELWRVSEDGEIRDTFKKLRYIFH